MIVVQLAVSYVWLSLIIRMDRHRKKKRTESIFALLYLFGLLSAAVTTVIYRVVPPWLSISGYYLFDNFLDNILVVGPVEEFSKFIVFYLIVRKLDSVREPTDGLLQGATVGLAFSAVENVMYTLWYGPGVIPFRAVFNIVGHMSYGGSVGGNLRDPHNG